MLETDFSGRVNKMAFIDSINSATKAGYGFVPFIGSGISHNSGIMVGDRLGGYLAYVVWLSVRDYDQSPGAGTKGGERRNGDGGVAWSLGTHGWPNVPSKADVASAKCWAVEKYCELLKTYKVERRMAENPVFLELCQESSGLYEVPPAKPQVFDFEACNVDKNLTVADLKRIDKWIRRLHAKRLANPSDDIFSPKKGASKTSRRYIVETAVRALYDWRLSLHFLARLGAENGRLHLANESDQYVIDSFNIFVTRGKRPCLAHQMVAFLALPLRVRKLITTNFDTLIEDAFRDINIPLQVFSVEKNSRLPDPKGVSLQKSLIKLHGSLHETRADFSLDETPSDADKAAFLDYIWPEPGPDSIGVPSHLLVMGTSIPDKRTVALIKHVCERSPEFRVFIIAYDQPTANSIIESFEDEGLDHIQMVVSSSLDLMLYEIYQILTYSLPTAGFKFEFSQYVPPFEGESSQDPVYAYISYYKSPDKIYRDEGRVMIDNAEYEKRLNAIFSRESKNYFVLDGKYDVTKLAAKLFFDFKSRHNKNCIWFELEDFSRPSDLLSELFRTVSNRAGFYAIENVNIDFMDPGKEFVDGISRKIDSLRRHYSIEDYSWCIFIHGRNVAGSGSGFYEDSIGSISNKKKWSGADFEGLSKVMEILSRSKFKVFYMPFSKLKASACTSLKLSEKFENSFINESMEIYMGSVGGDAPVDDNYGGKYVKVVFDGDKNLDVAESLENVWGDFILKGGGDERERRARLVYSTTLFRQSRHVSALLSEAVIEGFARYDCYMGVGSGGSVVSGRLNSSEVIIKWIDELYASKMRLFNRKPGGFAWMFRDLRLLSNHMLEQPLVILDREGRPIELNMKYKKARIHFWIGEWYLRAFYSSNHIDPLKEAIYHKLECIRNVKLSKREANEKGLGGDLVFRRTLLRCAFSSIAKILIISRGSLRYWAVGRLSTRFFAWKEISDVLGIGDRKIDQLRGDGFIKSLLVSDADEGDYETDKYFDEKLIDLISAVKDECLKLDRDVLRGSGYYLGRKGENGGAIPVPYSVDKVTFSGNEGDDEGEGEFELVFGFFPRDKWEDDFIESAEKIKKVFPRFKEVHEFCAKKYAADENGCAHKNRTDSVKIIQQNMANMAVDSPVLFGFLQLLAEYIFMKIRHAKYQNRRLCARARVFSMSGAGESACKDRREEAAIEEGWIQVGMLSQMALVLIHNLPSNYLNKEQHLRIRLLTYAGLSLGRLGRYYESHQMLNEATGLTNSMTSADSNRELVMLRLRRAEVHLREAISLKAELIAARGAVVARSAVVTGPFIIEGDTKEYRRHIAKLDDASFVLDEAEALLVNCMHSDVWGGKLYYLRLIICAEYYIPSLDANGIPYRPRVFQQREMLEDYLLKALEQGMLCCGDDEYRKLCFMNAFAKAVRKMSSYLDSMFGKNCQAFQRFKKRALKKVQDLLSITGDPEKLSAADFIANIPGTDWCKDDNFMQFREDVITNFKSIFLEADFHQSHFG